MSTVLGPISATAKLKLNPKPEVDSPKFSIPKVILSLHMEQLSVSLNKLQYQDIMLLADSMDMMTKAAPYRLELFAVPKALAPGKVTLLPLFAHSQ